MPSTIIWTALPHGPDNPATLNLSLYLSPRLTPSGTLHDMFAFTNDDPEPSGTNWPDRAGSVTLTVEFWGGTTSPVGPPVAVNAAPDPTLLSHDAWAALFPNSTPVRGYQLEDFSSRTIRSYSVRGIHQTIRNLYHTIAADPVSATSFPSIAQGTPLGTFIGNLGRLRGLIQDPPQTDRGGYIPDPFLQRIGQVAVDFYHAHKFYKRAVDPNDYNSNPYNPPAASQIPARPSIPDIDFHGALARLGDHTAILRMLGIILDCTLDISAATVPNVGFVRVTNINFGTPLSFPANYETPYTAYQRSPAGFLPRPLPGGSDVEDGLLKLADTMAFEAYEVDVDGAALSTLHFAWGVARAVALTQFGVREPQRIQPNNESVPALRSGGFTIARNGRDSAISGDFTRAMNANMALSNALLYADDISRGFRVDVLFRGTWYPICARNMNYDLGLASGPISVSDEGYIKAAASTGPTNPNGVTVFNDMFLHEALFTWKGWSMIAPRPGRPISLTPGTVPPQYVDTSQPGTQFAIRPQASVPPGTLPRLRFGDVYQFRMRIADLAGNGHSWPGTIGPDWLSVPGTNWPSPPRTYVRWEPVPGPALVQRTTLTPGESVETMVIRSQVGPFMLPASSFNATNERHVVPPKTSQIMAEEHGMFDGFLGNQVSAYRLARKEAGALSDRSYVDEDSGMLLTVPNIRLVVPSTVPFATPTVYQPDDTSAPWPATPGAPLGTGNYVIHIGDEVQTPYLPDPMSIGLMITGHPGGPPPPIVLRPFVTNGNWPKVRGLRILLNETLSSMVTIDAPPPTMANEVVTIGAPKATLQTLRYGSLLSPANLPMTGDPSGHIFALWEQLTDAERSARLADASNGQMWMLTPTRTLNVVHAVERPMQPPQVSASTVTRNLGETFQQLAGNIANHSHSTGSVEIVGRWTEEVDRIADPGPLFGANAEPHEGHVFVRKIDYGEDSALLDPIVPPKHEFGDTKHRFVAYVGVGETRYREYFGPEITGDKRNITFEGPLSARINVLSTARPDPPRIQYILPTFLWGTSGMTSTRTGRGLRVYLDRPWFSSGDGELLAVIMLTGPRFSRGSIVELRKYISQWGSDPVWNSDGPNVEIDPTHFENGVIQMDTLIPSEDDSLGLTAVGFRVEFNAERKLWYSDIVFRPQTSYYPFVRLALARLQPDSVNGAHISRIVKTEFMQLVSDRTASIVVDIVGGLKRVQITVNGPSASNEIGNQQSPTSQPQPSPPYYPSFDAGRGHLMLVHVESRQAGSTQDFAWQLVTGPVRLDSFIVNGSTDTYWRGEVRFQPQANMQYRLGVRELEIFQTDNDPNTAESGLPVSFVGRQIPIRSRLVYLDYLPVT